MRCHGIVRWRQRRPDDHQHAVLKVRGHQKHGRQSSGGCPPMPTPAFPHEHLSPLTLERQFAQPFAQFPRRKRGTSRSTVNLIYPRDGDALVGRSARLGPGRGASERQLSANRSADRRVPRALRREVGENACRRGGPGLARRAKGRRAKRSRLGHIKRQRRAFRPFELIKEKSVRHRVEIALPLARQNAGADQRSCSCRDPGTDGADSPLWH
jgi:hypothetical protein